MDLKVGQSHTPSHHTQHMNLNPNNGKLNNGFAFSLAQDVYDLDFQATNRRVQGYAPCSCSG